MAMVDVLFYHGIIICGILFCSVLSDAEDLDFEGACTHVYLYDIAYLDIVGGSCGLAVDNYLFCVAGFVSHCAALYKSCYLQVFVQSHNISLSCSCNKIGGQ